MLNLEFGWVWWCITTPANIGFGPVSSGKTTVSSARTRFSSVRMRVHPYEHVQAFHPCAWVYVRANENPSARAYSDLFIRTNESIFRTNENLSVRISSVYTQTIHPHERDCRSCEWESIRTDENLNKYYKCNCVCFHVSYVLICLTFKQRFVDLRWSLFGASLLGCVAACLQVSYITLFQNSGI